ncbi:unnamed protein product, partial [Chrysoparadoxa australica]
MAPKMPAPEWVRHMQSTWGLDWHWSCITGRQLWFVPGSGRGSSSSKLTADWMDLRAHENVLGLFRAFCRSGQLLCLEQLALATTHSGRASLRVMEMMKSLNEHDRDRLQQVQASVYQTLLKIRKAADRSQ